MVNLAIIGYGELASSVYGPAIAMLAPEARLAGIVELDPTRRRNAESRFPGVPVHASMQALLAAAEVEGVLIATPPTTHADLAVEAFAAGLAVYVEKPLAASHEDGQRIVDAWSRAATVGMVGFNYRFNSIVLDLRQSLARQAIGKVVSARTYFGLAADELPQWKRKRLSGGGALLDLASHHVDLLTFLLEADVQAVGCKIWSDRTEDDNALLTLTFSSQVVAQVQVSLSTVDEDRVEIHGRGGRLIYDRNFSERLQRTGRSSSQIRKQLLLNRCMSFVPGPDFREKLRSPWREPSFPRAVRNFVEAVASTESRSPDIGDGWRCLRVILAAEQANRDGRVQEVQT
jgi:myo-inositol 2-dehydrogenase/D-chiro-inositol 1-dehydrogenase